MLATLGGIDRDREDHVSPSPNDPALGPDPSDDRSDPSEENLRRFLEEVMGGQLPPDALAGVDLSALAKQANIPSDPTQLRAAAQQMQHMFESAGEGPVNWKLGQDLARRTASGEVRIPGAPDVVGSAGDPSPTPEQIRALTEAAQIASLWLDPQMAIDVPSHGLEVWSRGTWVHRTLPRWQSTVEPVATYMSGAIGDALAAQMEQMPEAARMPMGDPRQMMQRLGGTMFGVQFGHAIGSLAREEMGTTDMSLPLGPAGTPALVAVNVADLIADNELDPSAARIFLAAREIAHTALFTAVPWLPRQLFGAIEDYARGITLDLDALDEMVRGMDMADPEAMARSGPEGMFVFTRRASQERALEELATTLALVEAWVDHVVATTLEGKLPHLEAMREVVRRRRAAGSPAEQMLAQVVGIELRPRRVREALTWWESVTATEGIAGRDRMWEHPDLLPTSEVLSGRPQAPRTSGDSGAEEAETAQALPADFDAELARLLAGEGAESAPQEDEIGGVRRPSDDASDPDGGSAQDEGSTADGEDGAAEGDDDTEPNPGPSSR